MTNEIYKIEKLYEMGFDVLAVMGLYILKSQVLTSLYTLVTSDEW